MKILKISLIFLFILGLTNLGHAQKLNCQRTLDLRYPTKTFKIDQLSRSAACYTGRKYEFILPLNQKYDYRLMFYASPVFNNDMKFTILDQNTGEKVMELKGESETGNKGTCVLKDYFDDGTGASVHPFFDFFPQSSTTLRIIIDITSIEQEAPATKGYIPPEVRQKGCVTVFIQYKEKEGGW